MSSIAAAWYPTAAKTRSAAPRTCSRRCERGIRTYEDYVRNTLALAAVPALHKVSHLPVIVDPSQGTGKNYLVDPMCRAAVAACADGLIIEVHNDPEHALTDCAQSITPPQFAEMMTSSRRIALAVDREV